MDNYQDFAYVYDRLIEQDYEKWADYMETLFAHCGVQPELVLDLGCGTGSLAVLLAQRGYDMLGADPSCDMLQVAAEKARAANVDIRFLCQDARALELYGTVDAVLCTMDVLNYITDPAEILQVFRLVRNYLNPGGLLIFDVNTPYKLEHVLGNTTFIEDANGVFYTWENSFRDGVSTQLLTFFAEGADGRYTRFDETHVQRAYAAAELTAMLQKAGLEPLACFAPFSLRQPSETCEKIVFASKCLG